MIEYVRGLADLRKAEDNYLRMLIPVFMEHLGRKLGLHPDFILVRDIGFIYDDCGFIEYYDKTQGYKLFRITFPKTYLDKEFTFNEQAVSKDELTH